MINFHETKIRVQYYETDCMGIVHHSNYIRYFETARTEAMREWGVPYSELEKDGVQMPIISAECRYFIPARYDEILEVRTFIREKISARIRFEYEIYNGAGAKIATGSTELAFVNSETKRPCRPPEVLIAKFASHHSTAEGLNSNSDAALNSPIGE